MEKYTARDYLTKEIIKSGIIDWYEVEELLVEYPNAEYITEQ